MTQQATSLWRSRLMLVGRAVLLAGVGLASAFSLSVQQGTINPVEARPSQWAPTSLVPASQLSPNQLSPNQLPNQLAVNTWRGASFPVENFAAYTSPFGYRQSPYGGYTTEFHHGLDMAAPQGSYIRNWWTGKVVEVSDDSACGTSVVVESGPWEHIYCHMQGQVEKDANGRYMSDREGGIQIYEGQIVPAGTRIGRVGMTGRTTGPHLHWGLKYSGKWVDPALVLRAMYAEQAGQGEVTLRPR